MPRKPSKAVTTQARKQRNTPRQRNAYGEYLPAGQEGSPASVTIDPGGARRKLNLLTLETMRRVFEERGNGLRATRKVLKQQPAQFLKLMVLLVPREMEIINKTGPKGMSDEAIAEAITTIEQMLARRAPRAGDDAKLIEGKAEEAEDPSADST